MLDEIFKRFVNESPVTVMVGGLLERVLHSESLDAPFLIVRPNINTRASCCSPRYSK